MDLVKTLLVYMTVLLTSSTAFTPALTPAPANYPTPTPYVSQAPTQSPAPTVVVTAPAANATATPTPALTTLYVGDRGENVRVMQTRLKELGYLTGVVDGIFGQDTLRALKRFQAYNNLTEDGIAGSKTLNKLYFDPNVVISPVDVGPTPTTRPSATANVPVYYMSNTGTRLYTEVVTLSEGRTTLRANNARVPQGYVLVGNGQQTVTVSQNGTPRPASVTFTYTRTATQAPVSAKVTINYLDSNNKLLASETVTLPQGTTTLAANDRLVPAGYTLVGARTVDVIVSANGTANPAIINFVYKKAEVSVMVPVNYVDVDGKSLFNDQVNLTTGTHPVIANDGNVPQGYILQGEPVQEVVVDQDGKATPPSVTFTYKAPAKADVPVIYQDTQGKELYREVQSMKQGENTVTANQALVPEGYVLDGPESYVVNVDENGVASPNSVSFVYKAPAEATQTPTVAPTKAPTEAPTEEPTNAPTEEPQPVKEVKDLPEYQSVRFKDGSYPVFTGPGENYFRVDNATLGGGVSRLYGSEGDWLLVGYGTTDGGYRIGYITMDALPEGITAQALELAFAPMTLSRDAKINDDPIINPKAFGELSQGTQVSGLATLSDNPRYVYVEIADFMDGKPARGFINKDNLN